MRYRYSRWDGGQAAAELDPDELLHALADELVAGGELASAIRRLTVEGSPPTSGLSLPGLQHLRRQVGAKRQRELERYNLESILHDVRAQIEEIVASERETMSARLAETEGTPEQPGLLSSMIELQHRALDRLPAEPGGATTALDGHEFHDEQARVGFQALKDRLRDHVVQRQVSAFPSSLRQLATVELGAVTAMLHDLNALLDEHLGGGRPDHESFLGAHGSYFPGTTSLDDLVAAISEQTVASEALLASLPAGVRRELEALYSTAVRDPALRRELARLSETMRVLAPRESRSYAVCGTANLSLEQAMALMRRLIDLDRLEACLVRAEEGGELPALDLVRRTLGEEAAHAFEDLRQLSDVLEESGYVCRKGETLQLTTRGIRKIGQKALQDIFSHLKRDVIGEHGMQGNGSGMERTNETKRYEFGDAFLLDMHRTVMNGVVRGAGLPVRLRASDVEVSRTERLTRSTTVLMLDMSRSMPLRGCFVAAKRVALALHSLILTQFPRDRLHILTFADFAREIQPELLHELTWGEYVHGTNMQHGFMLARRLLGRETAGSKQIILITDGEPTAHWEDNRVHFAYPPTQRTFQETLREVKRCTREGIVINTFMLERSHYLNEFVSRMTRINQGRAFFATPERLGDYILVDYVASRTGRVAART